MSLQTNKTHHVEEYLKKSKVQAGGDNMMTTYRLSFQSPNS
jgi:hypothetical protein